MAGTNNSRRSVAQTETEVDGAAFLTPDQLESDISDFRGDFGVLPENDFVVANASELYVVFTDETPKRGYATIQGTELTGSIQHGDLTFDLIEASSVNINQTGAETTVGDIVSNPGQYSFELVRLQEHHQQLAIRTRDETGDLSFPVTTGIISEEDLSPSALFDKAARKIRSGIYDPVDAKLAARLGQFGDPFLYCGSFMNEFWEATAPTMDGLILPSGTKARDFLNEFDEQGVLFEAANEPFLSHVATQYENATQLSDAAAVSEQADGDIVTIEADVYQITISIQELIEETTSCTDPDLVRIPNIGCVPVPTDVVVHAGVLWTDIPSDEGDVAPLIGFSSWEQFDTTKIRNGTYSLTGEVVSTSRIDDSLPEATALLINDMEFVSEVDYTSLPSDATNLIENLTEEFNSVLKSQAEVDGDSLDLVTVEGYGESIPQGGSATIEFSAQEINHLQIENLWTDWTVVDVNSDGGSTTNDISEHGRYEISWTDRQPNVSPYLVIEPPEETYIGGEYLVDVYGNGGNDTSSVILTIS